jgi:hypothetical protein
VCTASGGLSSFRSNKSELLALARLLHLKLLEVGMVQKPYIMQN